MVSRKVWPNGCTIRVVFLDGSDAIKSRVAEIAKEWTRYANLTFDFSDGSPSPAQADVRVSFAYQGYWSFMGPDVTRHRNPANPTVSLEGLADEPDEKVQRVTLHEFGHVLELYHEHQNPSAHIQWNRDAVYRYLEQKQGWPRTLVDQEYLNPQPLNNVVYSTPFDPQSIMCYGVLAEFTADGLLIDYTRTLSDTDRAVVARLYPR